jgi:hypothetical protein
MDREQLFSHTKDILEAGRAFLECLQLVFAQFHDYIATKHTFHISSSYGVSSLCTNDEIPYLSNASSLHEQSDTNRPLILSKRVHVHDFAARASKGQ